MALRPRTLRLSPSIVAPQSFSIASSTSFSQAADRAETASSEQVAVVELRTAVPKAI